MDYDEAIAVLAEHRRLIDECGQTSWLTKDRKAALDRLNDHSSSANAVLGQFGLGTIGGTTLSWHRNAVCKIDRALVMLYQNRMLADASSRLGQPALPMSVLHPIVYKAAYKLWSNGNYRHAVGDAATSISTFTQRRLKRYDISDRELMAQVFSDKEPEKGKARLRSPGKRGTETTRSLQQGAQLFAMGTFQAIRNPAHHSIGDGDPVAAFESLAALSKVARWVSEWQVDEWFEPIDFKHQAIGAEGLVRNVKPKA